MKDHKVIIGAAEMIPAIPSPWAAILLLLASVLMGIVIQKTFVYRFKNLASRTSWRWDDTLVHSLGRMPVLWCFLAGLYFVKSTSEIGETLSGRLDQVIVTLIILSITAVFARLGAGFVSIASADENGKLPSSTLLINASRFIIYLIGFIVVLQNLNIEITPIITALGIGGLAVALALEETLNNLFSGVQIIASRIVRQGDYIKLDSGFEGYVTDIKARSTTILSFPDRNRIIVPNSVLASSTLINYSLPERSMWVELGCGVAYDSDLEQVEKVTLEVAQEVTKEVDGGISETPPAFRYDAFGDSSINFFVRLYIREFKDQFEIKNVLIKRLHQRFAKEGIEIPFPIRTVYMKNSKD